MSQGQKLQGSRRTRTVPRNERRALHSFFDQHVIEDDELGYIALGEGDYNALPAHLAARVVHTSIQNVEIPQLYPVFPYQQYGVGLPDLQLARGTWHYGVANAHQKDHVSWHQDAIFCARLGLTEEARDMTIKKLETPKVGGSRASGVPAMTGFRTIIGAGPE